MNVGQKKSNSKRCTLNARSGFSLVELLVTVSIFVVTTGIVLVSFPTFSSKIALDNLAHEVALAIRQAQVFGVAAKETIPGSGIFGGHGVRFDSSQNTTFYLFTDTDGNNKYSGSGELLETFNIQRRNYISSICGHLTSSSGCTALTAVDITFDRPDPEPTLLGNVQGSETLYSYVVLILSSPSGVARSVSVWSNGQIAIQ